MVRRLEHSFASAALSTWLVLGLSACGPAQSVDLAIPTDDGGSTGNNGGTSGSVGNGGSGGNNGGSSSNGGSGNGGNGGNGGSSSNGGTGGSGNGGTGSNGGTGGIGGVGGSSGNGGNGGSVVDARTNPPDTGSSPDAGSVTISGPYLNSMLGGGVATTNLTTGGTLDWMHWGLGGSSGVNRKAGATSLVTMTGVGGKITDHYSDRPIKFSWTDGTPTTTGNSVPDGIAIGDTVGRGFELQVKGDPARARTVRLYVGVWGARGKMTATVGTAAPFIDATLTAGDPGADRVYTFVFQPSSASETLVMRWLTDAVNKTYGNVTLQAITVSE